MDKVKQRVQLKTSISRFVTILFPELKKLIPTPHIKSAYTLLYKFPNTEVIVNTHLTKLTNLLHASSKGLYIKETTI